MRKKSSYVVVIATTIFCVFIILYGNDIPEFSFDSSSIQKKLEALISSKKSDVNKSKVIVNKPADNNSNVNKSTTNQSATDDKKSTQQDKPKTSDTSKQKNDVNDNKITNNEAEANKKQNTDNSNSANLSNSSNSSSSLENNSNTEENNSNAQEDNISNQNDYLKEPINNIIKDMSFIDKARLLTIANKISPTDYAKINNYLSNSDSDNNVKNVYNLLKTKLSKKDFAEFEQVAGKFVYLDKLEK
jgi:hypothetical protein